ncbi:Ger(x)C family spore germination protein [Salipaludibacillus keqinensis]|nr:Ger(x)C family spore germination protein [Salipaludibacillus keqinensis]
MRKITPIILLFLFLTGCLNANEIERMYYVHGVGLDYVDEKYEVYIQIMNFSTMAKEVEPTGETAETVVAKGVGSTPVKAIHELYRSTPQRIYWGHLSAVVFTEAALNTGMTELLDDFLRFNEIRYTPWVFSTKSNIDDILTVSPFLEASPVLGTLGNPTDGYSQSSYVAPKRKHRFILELNEPGKSANIPCLTVEERWHSHDGQHPTLNILGVSSLFGEEYRGTLQGGDMYGLRWMQEETQRTPVQIKKEDESFAVVMMKNPEHKITSTIENGQVFFTIEVKVSGGILEMDKQQSLDFIKKEATKTIENEIRMTYEKGLENKADIYHFSNELFKKDPKAWHKLTEEEELSLTKESLKDINVQAEIIHSGKNRHIPILTETD